MSPRPGARAGLDWTGRQGGLLLRALVTNERPVDHNGSAAFHGGEAVRADHARRCIRHRGRRRYRNELRVRMDRLLLPRALSGIRNPGSF